MTKVKVPKRIAGVKVPKKLRKQARKVLKVTSSPLAREFAIAGLTLAATHMLDGQARRRNGADAGTGARPDRRAKGGLDGLDLGALIEAAAAEGARRFMEACEAVAPTPAAKPAPAAKASPKAPRKPAAPDAPGRRRPGAAAKA